MEYIKNNKGFWVYIMAVFCLLNISGCQTVNPDEEVLNDLGNVDFYNDIAEHDQYPEPERVGIYHKVNKGETLWRIAKAYRVSINDIISVNNIPDAAEIEKDQLVFIPGADSIKEIIVEDEAKAGEFVWPIEGKVIKYFNQPFGNSLNRGLNIKAKPGDKIKAARSGRVVFADFLSGYGHTVILDHEDGYHSVYAHNAKILVKLGEYITKLTPIAQIGMDSQLAYAHFQIRHNAMVENPMFYLP